MRVAIIIAALLMGGGIAAGGYFISDIMYKSKTAINTAEVKGLAERRVKADMGDIRVNFTVNQEQDEPIEAMYATAKRQQARIVEAIKTAGFDETTINKGTLQYSQQKFRNNSGAVTATEEAIYGNLFMETDKVDDLQALKTQLGDLLTQGIQIESINTNLRFTGLNAIKPEMLKEATKNARIAADEFASHANVTVGGIQSARQGGFTITDVGEDYGDTQKMYKNVRVVTTIDFYLEDK